MNHSPIHQLFQHRRIIALSTLATWALCAVLLGCLMGKSASAVTTLDHAEMAQEHVKAHSNGHHEGAGSSADTGCCETEHDPVSVSVIASLLIPLGLALALLLPHLRHAGTAWLRQHYLPFRLRPPRYHLVYCSLLH